MDSLPVILCCIQHNYIRFQERGYRKTILLRRHAGYSLYTVCEGISGMVLQPVFKE